MWQNPKLDWDTNPVSPIGVDFNRIEGNIDFLKGDIEKKKGLIVNALSDAGIATLISDTHLQIAGKITMAKKAGISIMPGTSNQLIPPGIYRDSSGVVLGDVDLISANIRDKKSIFGVIGSLKQQTDLSQHLSVTGTLDTSSLEGILLFITDTDAHDYNKLLFFVRVQRGTCVLTANDNFSYLIATAGSPTTFTITSSVTLPVGRYLIGNFNSATITLRFTSGDEFNGIYLMID